MSGADIVTGFVEGVLRDDSRAEKAAAKYDVVTPELPVRDRAFVAAAKFGIGVVAAVAALALFPLAILAAIRFSSTEASVAAFAGTLLLVFPVWKLRCVAKAALLERFTHRAMMLTVATATAPVPVPAENVDAIR